MKPYPKKWEVIDRIAENNGVLRDTRRKWRERGVPAKWQIKIVKDAEGVLSFSDFASIGSAKAAAR